MPGLSIRLGSEPRPRREIKPQGAPAVSTGVILGTELDD